MITLRAKFKNGQVWFMEKVPFSGEHDVLVTFLTPEENVSQTPPEEYTEPLNHREVEALRLAQRGLKTEAIAKEMGINSGTARNYLSSAYRKLNVANRLEAVNKAVSLGILTPL